MKIEERYIGDVVILDLKGQNTLGDKDDIATKAEALATQGHKNQVVNLASIGRADSDGIGELVKAFVAVKRQGGTLKLLNVCKQIEDKLVITKLINTMFAVFDDEAAAVRSFQPSAAPAGVAGGPVGMGN